jgi:hypothetical protein
MTVAVHFSLSKIGKPRKGQGDKPFASGKADFGKVLALDRGHD